MVYDYECKDCGNEFEAFNSVAGRKMSNCPKCGSVADMVFSPSASRTLFFPFEPYVDEHIGDDPTLIESRAQRKEVAERNGLEIKD